MLTLEHGNYSCADSRYQCCCRYGKICESKQRTQQTSNTGTAEDTASPAAPQMPHMPNRMHSLLIHKHPCSAHGGLGSIYVFLVSHPRSGIWNPAPIHCSNRMSDTPPAAVTTNHVLQLAPAASLHPLTFIKSAGHQGTSKTPTCHSCDHGWAGQGTHVTNNALAKAESDLQLPKCESVLVANCRSTSSGGACETLALRLQKLVLGPSCCLPSIYPRPHSRLWL